MKGSMAPRTKHQEEDVQDLLTEPEGWRTWAGRTQALAIIGCDKARFRQLIAENTLIEYRAPDGSVRYTPESIERAKEEQFWVEPGPREMAGAGISVGGVAIKSVEQQLDVLKVICGHLDKQQAHYTQTIDYAMNALKSAIDFQGRIIADQRAQLTRQTTEFRKSDLERLEAETDAKVKLAAEDRKTLMVAELVPRVAPLLATVSDAAQGALAGLSPQRAQRSAPAPVASEEQTPEAPQEQPSRRAPDLAETGAELLRKFGPEKLSLLRDSGMLSDDEQSLICGAIEALKGSDT